MNQNGSQNQTTASAAQPQTGIIRDAVLKTTSSGVRYLEVTVELLPPASPGSTVVLKYYFESSEKARRYLKEMLSRVGIQVNNQTEFMDRYRELVGKRVIITSVSDANYISGLDKSECAPEAQEVAEEIQW